MENSDISEIEIQNYAANLLFTENKNSVEVKALLIEKGVNNTEAEALIENLEEQMRDTKKSQAQKDILWGAVWCIGGLVGTFAETGFVFWGAIVFGGIQLIKGLINYNSN
jgi:hypothetical protein